MAAAFVKSGGAVSKSARGVKLTQEERQKHERIYNMISERFREKTDQLKQIYGVV